MNDFKASSEGMEGKGRANNVRKKFLEAPWLRFKTFVLAIFGAIKVCYKECRFFKTKRRLDGNSRW